MQEDEDREGALTVKNQEDRREYARASAECPVIYRILNPIDAFQTASIFDRTSLLPSFEMTEKPYASGEGINPYMLELLLWLDWKVNYLIKTLTKAESEKAFPYRAAIVDISAAGMRMKTAHALTHGSLLGFEFVLPILPFREMFLVGEVVRCHKVHRKKSDSEYEAAIIFKDMKDPDREQIIRYVVKRQMQLQRERKTV